MPGSYLPTQSHRFIHELYDRDVLLRNYTQNIDMLERLAGVPEEYIVEAHGSFHKAHCVGRARPANTSTSSSPEAASGLAGGVGHTADDEVSVEDETDSIDSSTHDLGCGREYSVDKFKELIRNNDTPRCETCDGLIKPDIVFFGEQLPRKFHELHPRDFKECDALIVMGTSLQVMPFAGLINSVRPNVPRLLINRDACGVSGHATKGFDFSGEYQKYRRDALFMGTCDEGARRLLQLLGWESSGEQCKIASEQEPTLQHQDTETDTLEKKEEADELVQLVQQLNL
jgi:NAD+-dependent protein deacetylase sirtuin 2